MKYLEKELRNILENSILRARKISEEAAEIAIRQLGVEKSSPYEYLSEQERILRRRLRVHGRQLGDLRDSKEETQEIDRLIEEVAYEHWHRMLFAKFLFENNLLMYFDDGDIENAVSISFEECEEIAKELGFYNGWELAAKLSAKMLPQIFRADSPVFELKFPIEKQMELEKIIYELPKDIFGASDSLGWVYQFWQKNKKDEVNKSEVKIGARELPAVTQLFTEPYMVSFLLDNSLGAWWAKKRLTKEDLANLKTEEELRDKLKIGSLQFDYTRFVKSDDGWFIAGGNTEGWPEELSQLKMIDPCCGSGHFLVSIFQKLVPIRMYLENISVKDACDKVLIENIHGLEIDQRCVELAAFAMALTAWNYPDAGGFRVLPELHIAWCGQSVNMNKDEWLSIADNNEELKFHLNGLYDIFKEAPILGSLIDPIEYFKYGSMFENEISVINKLLKERLNNKFKGETELAVAAQGIEKAFLLLSNKYHFVITNVPYLKGGNQDIKLKEFCEKNYPLSKYDLATVFIQRINNLLCSKGTSCIVTQQAWLFSKYYEGLREYLLKNYILKFTARLGPNAFESISGEHVNVCLSIIENIDLKANTVQFGYDLDQYKSISEKSEQLITKDIVKVLQKDQLNNANFRIVFDEDISKKKTLLAIYSDFGKGSVSGDRPHYIRCFWEFEKIQEYTKYWLNSPDHDSLWSGRQELILWGSGHNPQNEIGFRYHGQRVHGSKGIAIAKTGKLRFTPYTGELFDDNVVVLKPYQNKDIQVVWEYCNSDEFIDNLRKIDKKLCVTAGTFPQVEFDYTRWSENTKDDNIIGKPYSKDPTQWIFHGHPTDSTNPLQVAVARLLGFKWPSESDSSLELSDQSILMIQQTEELLQYSDSDGILCIPSVRGEAPASEKLLDILAAAYKGKNITDITTKLLSKNDHDGKSLESWLRDKFFSQHVKLFNNRPFIWQVWDGLPDGFSVLLNYHKLDRKNLETLIYTYLGDWINKQKNDIVTGVDGAEEKLAAAETLKKSLELILNGEQPYDIFVRWKSIDKQPIGWQPDINDGVRLNIRPFMSVPDIGKRGAGILRDKPNINWNKDRGKDTTDSPWYKVFNGERINDYHLSLEEKISAREEER